MAWVLLSAGATGGADGEARGPTDLGRVFERHHSAVVAVRAGTRWNAGFIVGGNGEIVVGASQPPPDPFEVRLASGRRHPAELLGFDARHGLAVGRLVGLKTVPLPIGEARALRRERWMLVMAVDHLGAPEPFAGVVVSGPGSKRPWAKLMASARPGSAVLDTRGRLVGVALDRASRRTRVIPFEDMVPFLKQTAGEEPQP